MNKPLMGDSYQHYKGGMYRFLMAARSTKDESLYVIYADSNGDIWTRPASEFFGTVVVGGSEVDRFIRMQDDLLTQDDLLAEIEMIAQIGLAPMTGSVTIKPGDTWRDLK